MTEEETFDAFVRSALEQGPGVGDGRLKALAAAADRTARRRWAWRLAMRWAPASLLAASVAVAVAIGTAVSRGKADAEVAEAIGLLCELDGIPGEDLAASSPGELLLAWQEGPCAEM